MNASTAILAALFGASRTGSGSHVDVAMTEGSLAHNIFALHAIETLGHVQARGRPPDRRRALLRRLCDAGRSLPGRRRA